MEINSHFTMKFSLLFFVLILLSFYLLSMGPYEVGVLDFLAQDLSSVESMIMWEIRLTRLMMAMISSTLLALSGLLMQSYFQNPIVGPYVLGIQSGASLGVAVFLLLGLSFQGGVVVGASFGALGTLLLILLCSRYLKQKVMLLILGLLLGQLLSGVVSVMALFSGAEQLKSFVVWGLGSFDRVGLSDLKLVLTLSLPLIFFTYLFVKPLNLLTLGDEYAQSLGLSLQSTKTALLILSGLMCALVSAYCGPIAFIGLIVPHMARAFFQTHDHRLLLPATALLACVVGVSVQVVALSFSPHHLPINTVIGALSAPVLIFFLLSKKGSAHVLS